LSQPVHASSDAIPERLEVAPPVRAKGGIERMMTRFLVLVLVLGALAGAFYGGRKYKGPVPFLDPGQAPLPAVSPAAEPEDPRLIFEKARSEVDADPKGWLARQFENDVTRQSIQGSLQGFGPDFIYLYGRASLLAGNNEEAARAFQALIAKIDTNPAPATATLRKEATFGLAAVALKLEAVRPAAQTRFDELIPALSSPLGIGSPQASPLSSPLASPISSPLRSP
jgi:hypothetical protein